MNSPFRVIPLVCVVLLGSLAVTGCSSKSAAPDKMSADKMDDGKMGMDKMAGDKMAGDKMADEKMK